MNDRRLRILMIEDDDAHAMLLTLAIEEFDVAESIEREIDGQAGLDRLEASAAKGAPDVVLLDLNLPKLSGLEVLTRVKENKLLRGIPVVILTTSSADSDRAAAYESHANSYLVKPHDVAEMTAMIGRMLEYWSKCNQPAGSPT